MWGYYEIADHEIVDHELPDSIWPTVKSPTIIRLSPVKSPTINSSTFSSIQKNFYELRHVVKTKDNLTYKILKLKINLDYHRSLNKN